MNDRVGTFLGRDVYLFYSNKLLNLIQENDPGMYTLLCLDATDASRHSNTREMLNNLYKKLLQGKILPCVQCHCQMMEFCDKLTRNPFISEFDLVHSDGSVRYNEFVSLLAFGCDGKIHIEQPFLPEFPREDSFNHIIGTCKKEKNNKLFC